MIANAAWFNRRKYTGWGLTPKTWQGVLYIIMIAGIVILVQSLRVAEILKIVFTGIWVAVVLVDILQVMASIKLDEREQKIEAISERNAAWTMVATTVLVILYVTTLGKEIKGIELMPVLIYPILTGVIAKGLSNFILERRGV